MGREGSGAASNQRDLLHGEQVRSDALHRPKKQTGPLVSKVYILIVNWNGWGDTVECLESVFRNDYPDYQVIVCDNGSEDGSLDLIRAWAEGNLDVFVPEDNPLRRLSIPPFAKPVPWVELDREQAETGGAGARDGARLILVQTGANLGFAGGDNR